MHEQKTKRIIMSQLPISQEPVSIDCLRENVQADMEAMGHKINSEEFMDALTSLENEQVLVFFGNSKNMPVIATQYGFRIYGTD